MTSPDEAAAQERRRLTTASTVAGVLAEHVENLVELRREQLPRWVAQLPIPPGWQLANLGNSGVQPARICVYGANPGRVWDGCETLSLFTFTGAPPIDVVFANADCTLKDLDAADITKQPLSAPPTPDAVAVRSIGHFIAAGRGIWAQHSTYIRGSTKTGQGWLIQHSLFVEKASQHLFNDAIAQISDAVHHAFLAVP